MQEMLNFQHAAWNKRGINYDNKFAYMCGSSGNCRDSNGKMQCYSDWEYEDAQNSLQHIYGGRVCNCSFNKYLYWRMKGEQDVCNI